MVYLVWARVHVLLIDTEKWNLTHTLKNMYNCCELDLFVVLLCADLTSGPSSLESLHWGMPSQALYTAIQSPEWHWNWKRPQWDVAFFAVFVIAARCTKYSKIQWKLCDHHLIHCNLPLIVAGVVIASFAADLSLPPSEYFLFKLFNSISFCDNGTFDGLPDAFLLLEAVGAEIFLSKDKTALV